MGLLGKRFGNNMQRHGDNSEHAELWIVSYADMMTLLFGFFVILYSLSQVDDKKFSAVGKELAETFRGQVDKSETEVGQLMDARQIRALQMLLAMLNLGENVEQAVENIERKAAGAQSMDAARRMLIEDLKAKDQDATLESLRLNVTHKDDQVEIALPDTMLFESGTADLTPRAKVGLKRIAGFLTRIKGLASIEVIGHTDSLPPSRSSKYPSNFALSAARAGAVTEEIMKHGVEGKNVATRGMASLQPLFPERRSDGSIIPDNLAKNRRVSILVKKAHYETPK